MNKTYALVWNHALGCWNAVGETARRRGKSGGGKLVAAGAVSLLGLAALPAHALPTGHAVVAGQADIATSADGKTMSINQHSDKLITNWQDFGVAGGERVSFQQPGSSSIALNRVIGTHGSQIDGRIDANGKVFLVNPNGVMFGAGSQVNVGSLVASTQNLSDADFLAGNYRFAGASAAAVVNAGSITAADGGSVALLGARVSNTGVIQAKMGRVALGAGQAFKVNFDGSDLLSVQVEGGAIDAQASNGGLLKADGGEVLMTARAAGNLLNAVVNNTGAIEARGLTSRGGRITLDGDAVLAGGKLDASATAGHGGDVTTRGTRVRIADDATVDTRGANGRSGTWKIDTANARVADDANATIGAAALSRNLDTTHVALTGAADDLSIAGPVNWSGDHTLSLTSQQGGVKLQGALNARGGRAGLAVDAAQRIDIDSPLALTGANATLELNSGDGHVLNGNAAVTLSGPNASFRANGDAYRVIHTVDELRAVDADLNGRYVLGNRIDGGGRSFRSIGGNAMFNGTFDGLGNTISRLSVHNSGSYVGLFAVNLGRIANLTLDALTARGTANGAAGLAAVGALTGLNLEGEVSNVNARNIRVSDGGSPGNFVGGLVGKNTAGGTIIHSSAHGVVDATAAAAVGGLVGKNEYGAAIFRSNAAVSVNGGKSTAIGGLVGVNAATILASSASGGVRATAVEHVGGLVGNNASRGMIVDSTASGDVVASGPASVGGLVGGNAGTVHNGQSSGTVTAAADSSVGGLAGSNTGAIRASAAAGNVVAGLRARAGGLVGDNGGTVATAHATGNVVAGNDSHVGGLVGYNAGTIDGGKASGSVVSATRSNVGGLVGTNALNARVAASKSFGKIGGVGAYLGGLVAWNEGSIEGSMSHSAIDFTPMNNPTFVGALVGLNTGTIASSSAKSPTPGIKEVSFNLGKIE
ncbi:filamentous hemagglutinin [Burkholderia ubonensis]|uniref:two-partner secretion domain-containing protein n=1 Tax=Burkholderia ubonensis TaxID=101571 RepID=UPI00075F51D4|nr:GLUG motif-containing protein [Burkholderia ubonensis]KVM46613.1 filamentous hemagglutinin [Burkholderia ubonensis]